MTMMTIAWGFVLLQTAGGAGIAAGVVKNDLRIVENYSLPFLIGSAGAMLACWLA